MRDTYFDNVKFFLVALVVLGHMAFGPIASRSESFNAMYIFVYLFHMPLFVFVSGYFSKNIGKEDYGQKIISKIIIPYLVFDTIYRLFDNYIFDKDFHISIFSPYYQLWFLMSLAIWKIMLPIIIKIKYSLLVSVVIAIAIGYVSNVGGFLSLSRTFVFLPLFLAGYFLDKRHLEILFKPLVKVLSLIILVVAFLLIYNNERDINKAMILGNISYKSMGYGEWYAGVYRSFALIGTVLLSISFLSIVPKRKIPLISDMGTRTMYVFIFHAFLVQYLYHIKFYDMLNVGYEKLLWIVICIVFVMVLSTKTVRSIFKFIVEPRVEWVFKSSNNFKDKSTENKEISTSV